MQFIQYFYLFISQNSCAQNNIGICQYKGNEFEFLPVCDDSTLKCNCRNVYPNDLICLKKAKLITELNKYLEAFKNHGFEVKDFANLKVETEKETSTELNEKQLIQDLTDIMIKTPVEYRYLTYKGKIDPTPPDLDIRRNIFLKIYEDLTNKRNSEVISKLEEYRTEIKSENEASSKTKIIKQGNNENNLKRMSLYKKILKSCEELKGKQEKDIVFILFEEKRQNFFMKDANLLIPKLMEIYRELKELNLYFFNCTESFPGFGDKRLVNLTSDSLSKLYKYYWKGHLFLELIDKQRNFYEFPERLNPECKKFYEEMLKEKFFTSISKDTLKLETRNYTNILFFVEYLGKTLKKEQVIMYTNQITILLRDLCDKKENIKKRKEELKRDVIDFNNDIHAKYGMLDPKSLKIDVELYSKMYRDFIVEKWEIISEEIDLYYLEEFNDLSYHFQKKYLSTFVNKILPLVFNFKETSISLLAITYNKLTNEQLKNLETLSKSYPQKDKE